MESARLLRAQADLERATKQYIYIGLSLHQTLSLLILHNRSTTVMELKNEFKVSDKHLWWIKVNALTSKQDWHALEAFAKERKSPIGYVTVTFTFTYICIASNPHRLTTPQANARWTLAFTPRFLQGDFRAGGRVHTPSRVAPPREAPSAVEHPQGSSTYLPVQIGEHVRAMRQLGSSR